MMTFSSCRSDNMDLMIYKWASRLNLHRFPTPASLNGGLQCAAFIHSVIYSNTLSFSIELCIQTV